MAGYRVWDYPLWLARLVYKNYRDWETDATMTWYRGYSNYDYSTTKTNSTGGWRMVAINSTGVTDRTGQYYEWVS